MAISPSVQKTLVMKPEVTKIFDDLEEWLDHCRFNLLKYDEKDLYRSQEYKTFAKEKRNHNNYNKPRNKKYEQRFSR